MLFKIILATFIVSLMSFAGLVLVGKKIEKKIHYMIAFAAAALLSVAFFDLIPHSLKHLGEVGVHAHDALIWVVVGIILFFLVERFIHWHHCGSSDCKKKPIGILILAGDFVHNFLDGILIAGAFLIDLRIGISTMIAIIIHEIPQEFGDYAVLLHAGYKRKKALLLNFFSALSAVLGGILGYFTFGIIEGIEPFAVLIAAGGFIYIALSDIVPALHAHGKEKGVSIKETLIFVLSIIGFKFFLEALH